MLLSLSLSCPPAAGNNRRRKLARSNEQLGEPGCLHAVGRQKESELASWPRGLERIEAQPILPSLAQHLREQSRCALAAAKP
mmetsp:Transcript_15704/g.23913  ORF Transcript_15704/g.23913 Transcript_15704/m.23913 type:complete len:82 (+) Transcript_15704:141-386(+)